MSQCKPKTLKTLSQADAGRKTLLKCKSEVWQSNGPHLPQPWPSHMPGDKVNIVHGETGSAKDVFAK